MNYIQTLDYLYTRLPMFTRIGAAAMKKDLHNTIAMCNSLGNPQDKFKTIHIGGTNGKGSTSHMLAAILQEAGYKTGLYTSPHLKNFRERIRVNGKMISEDYVVAFTAQEKELIEDLNPSFFEVTVAMAFAYFEAQEVDIAIIEVGLGGRLDSTNIITPKLSIITNISLDHTNLLGNTVSEIALEKAGIIKAGVPVVIGERQQETEAIFINKAQETTSKLIFANQELSIEGVHRDGIHLVANIYKNHSPLFENLKLDLTGTYQLKNVLTVLQAVTELMDLGFAIPSAAVYQALANTVDITGLQGRWQTLSEKPLVICDTGHNLAGIHEVLDNIAATPHDQLHIVIGMLKDKDITSVLELLPTTARYYFCEPLLERAMPADELAQRAEALQLVGDVFPTVALALIAAKDNAATDDLIFVGGSTFVVAEVL
jgi:dihydrofolate synthase/folylpolyglutamate synthase